MREKILYMVLLQNWKKKMSNEELFGVEYDLVPDPDDSEQWLIKLLKGPCKDVYVKFGRLRFLPVDEKEIQSDGEFEERPPFVFEWSFMPPFPEGKEDMILSDKDSEELEELLATIAYELLANWLSYAASLKDFSIDCEQSED